MESQRPTQSPGEPNLGMCGCDRDIFLQVWHRVMPEERPDCPIQVEPPQNPEPVPGPEPIPEPEASLSGPEGTVQPLTVSEGAADDFPTPDDVPCLGSGAQPDLEQVQEFISQELAHWRAYQGLARRVSGPGARVLSALAGGTRRRAKRLSAAQFLISGIRFWPAEQGAVPAPRSYFAALREHFLAEQNRGCAYRAAAEDCRDACLKALYLELAEECNEHARRIRALLESM